MRQIVAIANHSHIGYIEYVTPSVPTSGQPPLSIPLDGFRPGEDGVIESVREVVPNDAVALRLREIGFVKDEPVRIVGMGPIGGDPLLVEIGFTRFALRRSEAHRILVVRS